jgi:hypothetical protein
VKIHPLMLAAAIAFWGWQSGQWLVAAIIAVALYASFYLGLRWDIGTARLRRVADACLVLALLLGDYFYLTVGNPGGLILFFQWLPVAYAPLAMAHAYGTAERMDESVLFWSMRRPSRQPELFDPWFPYYAAWIVAASAANMRSEWFYVALVVLVGWPLLRVRPRSQHLVTWCLAFLVAIGLGYGLQYQLHVTQTWLEDAVPEWISGDGSLTDPYRTSTSMGSIGKLKESDAIVLRVVPAEGTSPPPLLHLASYNAYFDKAWIAGSAGFANVKPAANNRWPLATAHASVARVTIYDYTARLNPVISLPSGTLAIEGSKLVSAQRNRLGTVQVMRQPGFFSYIADYAGDQTSEDAPTDEDLKLPTRERDAFQTLAKQLGLAALPPAARVDRIRAYFADGFQYSTYLQEAPNDSSPIVNFLLHSKSGHCEYFATATTLLLRASGVPARYATGFAIREKSRLENAYIARLRHRHAWVRVFVNGGWADLDTTPPSWNEIEAEDSGVWTALADVWSWLRFRTAQAWADGDERLFIGGGLLLALPLLAWLVRRLYRSRSKTVRKAKKPITAAAPTTGSDSDYYRIERRLRQLGQGRREQDTTQEWLARLADDARIDTIALGEIVALHNRYRFDPQGLTAEQRDLLRTATARWLEKFAPVT